MSVMPISERHFCIVANSLSSLKNPFVKPLFWDDIKELVSSLNEMNDYAYSKRYDDAVVNYGLRFEKCEALGTVNDMALLKLLECIAYNMPEGTKKKKWMDAEMQLKQLIKAITDNFISEHADYKSAEWSL